MNPPNEPLDSQTMLLIDIRERVARLESMPEDLREMKSQNYQTSETANTALNISRQNEKEIGEIQDREKWRNRSLGAVAFGLIGQLAWKLLGG